MTLFRITGISGLVLMATAHMAHAETCKLSIEGNDMMQYGARTLEVPANCNEVEVELKHTGHLAANVMGHDWVLAKASDMSAIVSAGMAAGFAHGYLPEGDKRIIAATKVVGGGEITTVKFSTAALQEGVDYLFFCTTPGHATMMRGKFVFGGATRVAKLTAGQHPK